MEAGRRYQLVTNQVAWNAIACPPPEDNLNERPVKWCSVSLSDVISRGKRLEASVFDVEAKQAYEIVSHGKYNSVNLIGNNAPVKCAYYGARLKRNYVSRTHKNSIGFVGSAEMLDCYPQPIKFMEDSARTSDLHVKCETLLLSRSGTIGNLAFVSKTLSKMLVSEHAIRMECNEHPGYVYTYLKTRIGQLILKSNVYGAVIQEIEPDHLASIPIPDAPPILKQEIHQLIVRSYDLRDESNALLDEAEALLKAELHLPELDELDVKRYDQTADVDTFNVKLHDMNGRLDASYHVPIVDAIVTHLEKYAAEVTTVGDKRISNDVILPGRFKRVYVEEGYGCVFIGGKQIYELDPSEKKYLSKKNHAKIMNALAVKQNTLLITRSGTIGKVILVPKHWNQWILSEHIIRVIPSNVDIAGYMFVYLASQYAAPLIKRYTYGAVVDEIDDRHVREIPFPILKNHEIQKKINMLALQANEKRYEAYQLEQKALKLMNEKVIFAQ